MPLPLIPIAIGGAVALGGVIAISAFMHRLKIISTTEGYEKASAEFEKKYKKQYEDFMSKQKTAEKNVKEWKELVNAYKQYITELERELEDLKARGMQSESSKAIVATGAILPNYKQGMEETLQKYKAQLHNLLLLAGE